MNNARRITLLLLTSVGLLASLSATASAAAPETPETKPATGVTGTSAILHGVLNPHAAFGEEGEKYKFFYKQSATECQGEGNVEEPQLAVPATGAQAEAVSATPTDLLPHTTYTFCVFVRNAEFESSVGAPETFVTPGAAPVITEVSFTGLRSDEVTLTALIAPGGEATTYEVEYEPGRFTATQSLPAALSAIPVRQRITGLTPDTEYHARFLATNALGSGEGTIEDLRSADVLSSGSGSSEACPNSTFSGFSLGLPDCRADELVSDSTEVGEVYDPGGSFNEEDVTTARPFRAADDGGLVAYLADPGPVGGDGSSAKGKGNEYLAVRGPDAGLDGWEASDITPPVGESEEASLEREYEAFSPDLSVGIVASQQPLTQAAPSPQGPNRCNVLYSRNSDAGLGGEFHALFTETQTPGRCGEAGTGEAQPQGYDSRLIFAGETADHSQNIFQTEAPLIAPAAAAKELGSNLYDSSDADLTLVNVLPGGELDSHSTFGGPTEFQGNAPDLSNAVSEDGSRLFWSTVAEDHDIPGEALAEPVALYAREDPRSPLGRTVQLDLAQAGAVGPSGRGQFWTANKSGTEVFFTDCNRLTADSTADPSEGCERVHEERQLRTGNDLYEYDFTRPAGDRLVDLTVDHADAMAANVQGVLGTSQDGSYIYFVAGGSLGAGPNSRGEAPAEGKCEKAEPGAPEAKEQQGHAPAGQGCNLFVEHETGTGWEPPRFIATLAAIDNAAGTSSLNNPGFATGGRAGDWLPNLGARTAEVSSDGRHLVFSSTQQLTGYDASDVGEDISAHGGSEVFVYNAGTGALACASCNPTGAPPDPAIEADSEEGIPSKGANAYLPVSSSGTFMHRWMNSQGTEVFFDSSQPLVAGDSNGTQDVYEWEAEGSSSCPTATSRYGGCVFLLSGGESTDFSFLVDADESGDNVFVAHRGQLGGVGPDDGKNHLYDVRVGGGFPGSSLACTGTGCQGVPPAAPIFATPSSATIDGLDDLTPAQGKVAVRSLTRAQKLAKALKACKRDKPKRRRASCEAAARKRYGASKRTRTHSKQGRKS
jgi:hypothetical protein